MERLKEIMLMPAMSPYLEDMLLKDNNSNNCVPIDGSDMPDDIFTEEQRLHGAILLHMFAFIYCFILLTIVCNDYFLPSVKCIIRAVKISEDVGAAVFMSVATTTPEFFVSLIGLFIAKSDVGLGTIVGSEGFNLLFVSAIGGLAASVPISIEAYPVIRECTVYATCLGILIAIIWDNRIYWYESAILVVLYIIYIVLMLLHKQIDKTFRKWFSSGYKEKSDSSKSKKLNSVAIISESISIDSSHNSIDYGFFRYSEFKPTLEQSLSHKIDDSYSPPKVTKEKEVQKVDDDEDEIIDIWSMPQGTIFQKFWFFFVWPLRFILYITMVDCRKYPKFFIITFLTCIAWIGMNSYMITWMITIIGQTFHVPDMIMGMTFIAAGSGLPEATSITILSRKGIGGMGISNALGANVMDILMSLGLVWFANSMIYLKDGEKYFVIQSQGVGYTLMFLFVGIIILCTTLFFTKFVLYRRSGVILLTFYAIFITFAVLLQADVLFDLIPYCK